MLEDFPAVDFIVPFSQWHRLVCERTVGEIRAAGEMQEPGGTSAKSADDRHPTLSVRRRLPIHSTPVGMSVDNVAIRVPVCSTDAFPLSPACEALEEGNRTFRNESRPGVDNGVVILRDVFDEGCVLEAFPQNWLNPLSIRVFELVCLFLTTHEKVDCHTGEAGAVF